MRYLASLAFSCVCIPALHGQSAPLPEVTPKRHVVVVQRPPVSARPSAINRLSSAQRSALVHDKLENKQLPSFTANDRNGRPVAAAALPKSNHWIMIYRGQKCLPCDRLMTVLAASGTAAPRNGQPYVVVVGGNQPDGLEIVRANFSTLGDATWLSDKNDKVFAALKPHGTPTLYGMNGTNIEWTLPGSLGDPAKVERLASAWLATPPAATASNSTVAPGALTGAK